MDVHITGYGYTYRQCTCRFDWNADGDNVVYVAKNGDTELDLDLAIAVYKGEEHSFIASLDKEDAIELALKRAKDSLTEWTRTTGHGEKYRE